MLTNLYIDGFNLYYRALKDTPFKWLDLNKLAEVLFPSDSILRVCYFTARITSRPTDPSQAQRQQTCLRALDTLANVDIYYGNFRPRSITRPLVNPVPGLPTFVTVRDSEEKGSDVNLAMRLLVDGFNRTFEQAAVITNDSDLAGPVQYVRDELRLPVVVVNPDMRSPTQQTLQSVATRIVRLRRSHLRQSLFPPVLHDDRGPISKPPGR